MLRSAIILPAIMLCACDADRSAPNAEAVIAGEVADADYTNAPGRCEPFDASYIIAAGEYQDEVMPYVECLSSAEQKFGFNDGPYAVSQCKASRAEVLAAFDKDRLANIEYLMAQIDREYVRLQWCSTDVGSQLPEEIEIRSDWPQAQSKSL